MRGEPDNFGPRWAASKLDMPRRRRELEAYIAKWLPELRTMEPGLVLDVGCGPGDFLALCREMGHEVLGVDDFTGTPEMGSAYVSLCREHCDRLEIPVSDMAALLECNVSFNAINCRGAVEQIGKHVMVGPPHRNHHDCKQLDWCEDSSPEWLTKFLVLCESLMVRNGILLIAANGTRSTDEWYDATVRQAADESGLELVAQEGLLVHKWRKP